jgi:hypothetical protein
MHWKKIEKINLLKVSQKSSILLVNYLSPSKNFTTMDCVPVFVDTRPLGAIKPEPLTITGSPKSLPSWIPTLSEYISELKGTDTESSKYVACIGKAEALQKVLENPHLYVEVIERLKACMEYTSKFEKNLGLMGIGSKFDSHAVKCLVSWACKFLFGLEPRSFFAFVMNKKKILEIRNDYYDGYFGVSKEGPNIRSHVSIPEVHMLVVGRYDRCFGTVPKLEVLKNKIRRFIRIGEQPTYVPYPEDFSYSKDFWNTIFHKNQHIFNYFTTVFIRKKVTTTDIFRCCSCCISSSPGHSCISSTTVTENVEHIKSESVKKMEKSKSLCKVPMTFF